MATIRQKKAIENVLKGDSVSKAMTKAGYPSKTTARNPQQLTRSKAFTEIMESMGISDSKLAERLNEGLDATKAIVMGTKSEESFVDVVPDFAIRHKYVETSLKLKGHSLDKPITNVVVMPILQGLSREDVRHNDSNSQTSTA